MFISFSRHCWMSRSPVEALADRDQCWPPFSRSDTGTLMDPSHSDRRPGHNLNWSSTQRQNCTSNYFKSTTIKLLLTSCIDTSHWAHSLPGCCIHGNIGNCAGGLNLAISVWLVQQWPRASSGAIVMPWCRHYVISSSLLSRNCGTLIHSPSK